MVYNYDHYDKDDKTILALVSHEESIPMDEDDELFYLPVTPANTFQIQDGRIVIIYSSDAFIFEHEEAYGAWMIETRSVDNALEALSGKYLFPFNADVIMVIPENVAAILMNTGLRMSINEDDNLQLYDTLLGKYLAIDLDKNAFYLFNDMAFFENFGSAVDRRLV